MSYEIPTHFALLTFLDARLSRKKLHPAGKQKATKHESPAVPVLEAIAEVDLIQMNEGVDARRLFLCSAWHFRAPTPPSALPRLLVDPPSPPFGTSRAWRGPRVSPRQASTEGRSVEIRRSEPRSRGGKDCGQARLLVPQRVGQAHSMSMRSLFDTNVWSPDRYLNLRSADI